MPITQERMLTLLKEARNLERFLRDFRADLRDIISTTTLSAAQKLIVLDELLKETEMPINVTLALEWEHFTRAAKRNAATKERMRKQRERKGERA